MAGRLLAACSPANLLGWVQPAALGGEVRDIQYAPGPRHARDIYLPAASPKAPPIVVFFYGGGWTSGDRAAYRFVGRSLAACGALTVIPDYRVWPDTGFPGFPRDGAEAVAFARQEATRRGGDPARLFLMGHSAGGYIAAMLALDPAWLAAAGTDAGMALAGVVGLAGPYDFLPLSNPVLRKVFAPAEPRTQPITFAANARAPLLLPTGADDTIVYPRNTAQLAARVRETDAQVTTIIYPRIGHVGLLGAFATPLRFLAPVREDACEFFGLRPTAAADEAAVR